MIDLVMGAAGVDPNWTPEEWTAVLKYALYERDDARKEMENLRQLRYALEEQALRLLRELEAERGESARQRLVTQEVVALEKERDDARELAAMYLQCMNSRSLERGETVESVAAFCETEFAENPWLREEYRKLADQEASVKAFLAREGLKR